ncbi:hypothetical protein [Qipengyuania huizhouensis]|uniref:hypothetical protein n=1 Tax=Qipengyuania huizhouensis TaxID=2867245 RepID=UPI001C8868E6|nr:hypothetical protein [Qipengyuania huizhouensis]MBX7461567.1 hypothetical protein [Qipengyuania huizhouensis]
MKKNILLVASGSFMALHGVSAAAQETPPAETSIETETTTATPAANGEGAVVTRETTTTTATTDMGEVETEIDSMQSVETPSGNSTTIDRTTDADGKTTTTVDHTRMDHSAHKKEDSEEGDDKPETN